MTIEEMYSFLYNNVVDNHEVLAIAFSVGGFSKRTASKILYYYTGRRDIERFIEEMTEWDN